VAATVASVAVALADTPARTVRFAKIANSAFDPYTRDPSPAQQEWMRTHYHRMLAYSPYFDSRLAWFPDVWVYRDLYAIYVGSPLAGEHPAWILHDAGGEPLYIPWGCGGGTCPQYAGDVGSPEFRAHWIAETSAILAAGYRGIFVDDVNMLRSRVSDRFGTPRVPIDPRTAAPMTEEDWRRYVAEFTEAIRAAFPTAEIVHNVLWFVPPDDVFVERQLASADVVGLERGFNDGGIVGGGGTYGFDTFLGYIDWNHTRGRNVWFIAGATSDAAREYGLAGYLLVRDGDDTHGNVHASTPDDWWPGWDVALGAPRGPRYEWEGVLRRDYALGMVLVNPPGSAERVLQLDTLHRDLREVPATQVTLQAARGAVLRTIVGCGP
jgi:hypothetical protein